MRYVVDLGGERKAVELEPGGVRYEEAEAVHAEVSEVQSSPAVLVRIGAEVHRVVARRGSGRGRYTLWVDGYRFDAEALDERTRAIRDLSAAVAGPAGPAPIVAPMPGLIVRVSVSVGDSVEAGQGVVVMEAMKMENELRATTGGTVAAVEVAPGNAVEKGAVLIVLQ